MITSVRASPRSSPSAANSSLRRAPGSRAPRRRRRAIIANEPSPRSACACPNRSPHRRAASSAVRCSRVPSCQCPHTLWKVHSTTGSRHAWASNPARGGQVDHLEQHLVLGSSQASADALPPNVSGRHAGARPPRSISSPPGVEHHVRPAARCAGSGRASAGGGLAPLAALAQRRLLGGVGPQQVVERVPPGRALDEQRLALVRSRSAARACGERARRPGDAAAGALMSGPGCSPSSRNIRAAASGRCR